MFALPNVTSPVMGVVFRWSDKEIPPGTFAVRDYPDSVYAEMFRQLRTSFQFAVSSQSGHTFLVTSVAPREGKTTTAVNLAAALAWVGKRVILMETDLRRPAFHRYFPETNGREVGLSSLIADPTLNSYSALVQTSIPDLRVLGCGTIPHNAADLLNSARTRDIIREFGDDCDVLLLDSPPTMAASDAMILASYVDGVIVVGALGDTHISAFRDSVGLLQKSGTSIIGYILNKVKSTGFGYGHNRYRYQHYYYYYNHEEDTGGASVGGDGARSRFGHVPAIPAQVRRRVRRLIGRQTHGRGTATAQPTSIGGNGAAPQSERRSTMAARVGGQIRRLLDQDGRHRG